MELMFVVLIAAAFGLAVRYLFRGRETYGSVLLPAVSAAAASLVWVFLLWVPRLTFDGGWIWVISLLVGPLSAAVFAVFLPRARHASDRAKLSELSGGRIPAAA